MITAIVVPDDSGRPELDLLQRVAGTTLARYKLPRRMEVWDIHATSSARSSAPRYAGQSHPAPHPPRAEHRS